MSVTIEAIQSLIAELHNVVELIEDGHPVFAVEELEGQSGTITTILDLMKAEEEDADDAEDAAMREECNQQWKPLL